MNDSAGRRKRNPNFTAAEKQLLIKLVKQHKSVVLSTQCGAGILQAKNNAWKKIHHDFNSQTTSEIYRPMDCLKKFFDNVKKRIRMVRRRQLGGAGAEQTGSEKPEDSNVSNDTTDELFDTQGNEKDGDDDEGSGDESKPDGIKNEFESNFHNAIMESNWPSNTNSDDKDKNFTNDITQNSDEDLALSDDYHASTYPNPNPTIKEHPKKPPIPTVEYPTLQKQRRERNPRYSQLIARKMQLIDFQMQVMKEDVETRRAREQEEYDLKKHRDHQLFLMQCQRDREEHELKLANLKFELQLKKKRLNDSVVFGNG